MNFDETMLKRLVRAEREIERLKVKESPGAWLDYTPTISAQVGTFTTVSATGRYAKVGKVVHVQIVITITTNGTAATGIIATLPLVANANATDKRQLLYAREFAVNGYMGFGFITTLTDSVVVRKYDNTYLGGDGQAIVISGSYEAA